uniref:Uncharacterized protein n=1 Tax=Phage sp. ct17O1 TaxID=2825789 RepID=A0A8S5PKT6_9VIRU|nr:MAG TPA: hypothetical protein [Phage sp. ct17O1]DAW48584.1 MAG TPA: hypothetical protein [Caudoviricetes sp.]
MGDKKGKISDDLIKICSNSCSANFNKRQFGVELWNLSYLLLLFL